MVFVFDSSIPQPPAPDFAVEIGGLGKLYPTVGEDKPLPALKDLTLKIPRGKIVGLLGPNGAGKSTLINILSGLTLKTKGRVSVWSFDIDEHPRHVRAALGVVPQEINIDPFFTAREILELQAGLFGVPEEQRQTNQLLDMVDLEDMADRPSRTLSGGMRRRLMMAKAMVHNPPILILDEPTVGVDVEMRHSLWNSIERMNASGTTILLTTHYLEEAEALCDSIAIINHGQLIANDTKENLLARMGSKRVTLTLGREIEDVPQVLAKQGWEMVAPNQIALIYKPGATRIGQELLTIQALGFPILDIITKEADLETVFFEITRREDPEAELQEV